MQVFHASVEETACHGFEQVRHRGCVSAATDLFWGIYHRTASPCHPLSATVAFYSRLFVERTLDVVAICPALSSSHFLCILEDSSTGDGSQGSDFVDALISRQVRKCLRVEVVLWEVNGRVRIGTSLLQDGRIRSAAAV